MIPAGYPAPYPKLMGMQVLDVHRVTYSACSSGQVAYRCWLRQYARAVSSTSDQVDLRVCTHHSMFDTRHERSVGMA